MSWETWVLILGVLFGGGGIAAAIVAFAKLRSENRVNHSQAVLNEADAAHRIVEAAKDLLDPLNKRIDEQLLTIGNLQAELKAKDRCIEDQNTRIEKLEANLLLKENTIQAQAKKILELEAEVARQDDEIQQLRARLADFESRGKRKTGSLPISG